MKIFLLALAIIDYFGASVIIAVFYTAELSLIALILAGVGAAALVALNLSGTSHRATYMLVGMSIWVCVLKSGTHATLAGVVDLRLSCLAGRFIQALDDHRPFEGSSTEGCGPERAAHLT